MNYTIGKVYVPVKDCIVSKFTSFLNEVVYPLTDVMIYVPGSLFASHAQASAVLSTHKILFVTNPCKNENENKMLT